MKHPCDEGLTPACFAAAPEWAKQAFAVRLMSTLVPPSITRRLPKWKFQPNMIFPPGWQPGDPLPAGIVVAPETIIPPDWTPDDPLPMNISWDPAVPPADTGPTSPLYADPAAPGPRAPVAGAPKPPDVFYGYAESGDGYIFHRLFAWDLLVSAGAGTYTDNDDASRWNVAGYRQYYDDYELTRGFLAFDLSPIPAGATCLACTIRIHGYDYADGNVSVFQGTWTDPLVLDDYDAFTGTPFATIEWSLAVPYFSSYNYLTLNAAGRNYVQSQFGARAAFVLREYDHDVLEIDPGWPPVTLANGMLFRNYFNPLGQPEIMVTYSI